MPKKKILLVHNFYQIGGGEHTVFENERMMLKENGHDVVVYTRNNDELKKSKVKMLFLPLQTLWSFKTYFEVKKCIKEHSIDVVHCHNTFPLISPSVYYAARSLKVPVVQTIHNFRLLCPCGIFYRQGKICEECHKKNSFLPALKYRCYRNSLPQTFVVMCMLMFHRWIGTYKKISYIFLTEFNKSKFNQLLGANNENVFVKPNFVRSLSVERKKSVANKFIFAGRLDENKGIQFILNTWGSLPKDYVLYIYGDGSLKEWVQEKSTENENIVFCGFKAQAEILKELSEAKALLFPSLLYEGFPMVIAESFAIGIPVVSSNIGNQKDIIEQSKGGLVFENNNIKSFQRCLGIVVQENETYARNAKNYYSNILNEENNYKRLIEIYDQAKHIK